MFRRMPLRGFNSLLKFFFFSPFPNSSGSITNLIYNFEVSKNLTMKRDRTLLIFGPYLAINLNS